MAGDLRDFPADDDDMVLYDPPEGEVACDDRCGALEEPSTPDEVKAALEHWHRHGYLYGCAHAR